LTNSCRL